MKFILIVMWFAGNGSTGVSMQEFDTRLACEFAKNTIISTAATHHKPIAFCINKGTTWTTTR